MMELIISGVYVFQSEELILSGDINIGTHMYLLVIITIVSGRNTES